MTIVQPFAPPRHRREGDVGIGSLPADPAATGRRWRRWLPILAVLAAAAGLAWPATARLLVDRRPIVVGILRSVSGQSATSERAMLDAALLAIEEINRDGGLLGRPVRGVIADGGPDGTAVARQAERLIREEHACVVIGCGASADRRSVVQLIERADHLLVQPVAYEGLEQSPAVVSAGAVPNQQIAPAVQWCHDALSARRFLLVGPDDAWPRCINAIAADQIRGVGDEVVGEFYLPPGSTAVEDAVRRVVDLDPDVVLCSFTGDAAASFFDRLRAAGIGADATPVLALGLSEDDLRAMDIDDLVGHYSAASYFQSIDRPENLSFVRRFKARYGEDRATSDAGVGGYDSVRLWAQAVREVETTDVRRVRESLRHQSLDAPAGIIAVDPDTQHTWQPAFIGRVRGDRQFEILWTSRTAVRPTPFPLSRSRSTWEAFVDGVHRQLHRESTDRRLGPADGRPPLQPTTDRAAARGETGPR